MKSSSTSIGLDPRDTNYYHCLISVNGKNWMQLALNEDKRAVL